MSDDLLRPSDHEARATYHLNIGRSLFVAGEPWFAVCYFYSAYHMLKSGLLTDPAFHTFETARSIHPDFTISTAQTTNHSAPPHSARWPGLNQIVGLMYPQVAPHYIRLHEASIGVRHKMGLAPISPDALNRDINEVMRAYDAGEMRTITNR